MARWIINLSPMEREMITNGDRLDQCHRRTYQIIKVVEHICCTDHEGEIVAIKEGFGSCFSFESGLRGGSESSNWEGLWEQQLRRSSDRLLLRGGGVSDIRKDNNGERGMASIAVMEYLR